MASCQETYTLSQKRQPRCLYACSRTSQPIALMAHNYVFTSERLLPQQALPSLSILIDLTPFSRPIARLSQGILALTANFLTKTYALPDSTQNSTCLPQCTHILNWSYMYQYSKVLFIS